MTQEEKIRWMGTVLEEAKWWYGVVDRYLSDRSVTVRLNARITDIEKMIEEQKWGRDLERKIEENKRNGVAENQATWHLLDFGDDRCSERDK